MKEFVKEFLGPCIFTGFFEEIYKYYKVKKVGYSCYARICGGLFVPHIVSIKKNLGVDISYKKIDNEKMYFKYNILKTK